ncbi:sensor histidine kinase [Paraglaciecola sp.]|uniref:sensor histidine kinase n=1 Tax=Paraglaciecola sp. TaxID=1920173 RepID=UPI003EF8ACC2
MSDSELQKRIDLLERKLTREKKARNLAETQLEKYSLEIYETNQSLQTSLAFAKKKQAELEYLGSASNEVASEASLNELMANTVALTGQFSSADCGFYLVTQNGRLLSNDSYKLWQKNEGWCNDVDLIKRASELLPLDKSKAFDSWIVSPISDVDVGRKEVYHWITYTNFSIMNDRVAWIVFFSADDHLDVESLYVLETVRGHLLSGIRRRISDVRILKRTVQLQDTVSSLEVAKRQLVQSEKMASLGQLAAGVAHEINNPIAFVHSNMQILKEYLDDFIRLDQSIRKTLSKNQTLNQSQYDDFCEQIELSYLQEDSLSLLKSNLEGLQRVREIVDNLKSFSHAGDEVFSNISIFDCVESALKIAWNSLKYEYKVDNQLSKKCPPILGNLGQLQQVFVNLFMNAAQAMEGGGTLSISQTLEAKNLTIHVVDDGCGMDENTVAKLFTPFFTTKPVGVGTGLGLSISFAILEAHSAIIQVDSQLGKGSSFNITFPLL